MALTVFSYANAQAFLHLIGLDTDWNDFSTMSYHSMYDNKPNAKQSKENIPLKTIGIYRKGDKVEIFSLDYLLVPTKKGFLYATSKTVETKINLDDYDDFLKKEAKHYTLENSITKPIFFKTAKSVRRFMARQKASFADAINVDFEKISYINANFYLTTGFETEVTFGASWFLGTEKTAFYPLDWQGKLSHKLLSYIDNEDKNHIVRKAYIEHIVEGENDKDNQNNTKIDKNTTLPWADTIDKHEEVYFDFIFGNNGVYIIPLTLLNGNSSRRFLAPSRLPLIHPEMYKQLKLPMPNHHDVAFNRFVSPDKSTIIDITNGELSVKDATTKKVLATEKITYNKVIMSEFATDKYAQQWKQQFLKNK